MAVEGVVADAGRRQLPVTWDALAQDARFGGEDSLRATVEYVMERLFGRDLTVTEQSVLPRQVTQYAGKLIALELIGPGIDFWMNMSVMESTRGPDETVTYTNRAAELRERRKLLLDETRRDEAAVLALIPPFVGQRRSGIPRTNTIEDEFLTPSHQEFPRPYRVTARS